MGVIFSITVLTIFWATFISWAREGWQIEKNGLVVLLDLSSSMNRKIYLGKKFEIGKKILIDFISAIPDKMVQVPLKASLCSFGERPSAMKHPSRILYPAQTFNKILYLNTISQISSGSGPTPLGNALLESQREFSHLGNRIALLIISDGLQNCPPDGIEIAKEIKEKYGNRVCISSILIGDDPHGEKVLKKITEVGQCGYFAKASDLISPAVMRNYVYNVLGIKKIISKTCPVCAAHKMDACAKVPTVSVVYFDYNQTQIKSQFYPILNKLGHCLSKCNKKRAIIGGHTDSIGSKKYNLKLSLRRAEAVRKYLLSHFRLIPRQLVIVGYGESRPIADNCTPQGRAKNRRVEIILQ